jgi:hypothetical protein
VKNKSSVRFLTFLLIGAFGCGCRSGGSELKSVSIHAPAGNTRPDSIPKVDLNYLLGKFNPAQHPDFVNVGNPYAEKPDMMLRKEAFEAFQKMYEAAKTDGVMLRIISSTRTFGQQKAIWEEKWTRFAKEAPGAEQRALKILEYSAMPGASRHHWGTDVDLNDLNNPSFQPGGKFEKVYEWLTAHAAEYGFCQPYTAKDVNRPNGYNEERWHWSYTPLSIPFLDQYLQTVTDELLTGFTGCETAANIRVVEHYAAGINQECAGLKDPKK